MKFRLINTYTNNPYMNMAIDEALLNSKLPTLRFYQWKPAGLSIGYFQKINQIDTDFCEKNNIKIVRRLTGGNAVLHDKELTYSFIIDEDIMPKSITESYKEISKCLLKGIELFGLKPKMEDNIEKKESSAVCFNDPSWYEITINKRKLIGSAQKRIEGKLLQHGAILINIDIERYAGCFTDCSPDLIKKTGERVISLETELKKKIDYNEACEKIKKGFEKALAIEFKKSTLSKQEKELAQKLYKEKYSTKEWNFQK